MTKTIIFGNSGSGKSTLAKSMSSGSDVAHLDLDTIAWLPTNPPTRTPIVDAKHKISNFLIDNKSWVIEGCYADLLELVMPSADELIFLNLPIEICIKNAKSRPWEPHKYESKQAQDKNLDMLISWIKDYEKRTDTFSKTSHMALYNKFTGTKAMYSTQ